MNYLGKVLSGLLAVLLVISVIVFDIQFKKNGLWFLKISRGQGNYQDYAIKDCSFCKIITESKPDIILAENEDVVAIKSRTPCAPVHYLIIPKKHIVDLSCLTKADRQLAASLLMMAQELSHQDLKNRQFRLVNNNGSLVGQTVFHAHFHFLSGKVLPDTDYTLTGPDTILNEE
jgi:histidine triad (HIT) family protein